MWVHTDKVGYYKVMEFYKFYHTKFTGSELIRKSMNPRKELFFVVNFQEYTPPNTVLHSQEFHLVNLLNFVPLAVYSHLMSVEHPSKQT